MANIADTIVSIVREPASGNLASPVFRTLEGTAEFNVDSNFIQSDVMRPNRASGDTVEQGFSVTGSLTGEFRRDLGVDMILEGVHGGTFTSNVLKAGATDLSHTFEQKLVHSGTPLFFRYGGCQFSDFGLNIDASGKAQYTASLVGTTASQGTTILTSATYPAPVRGPLISGGGLGSIIIEGLTATYYSLEYRVTTAKSPKFALFNPSAFGVSTGGNRVVTATVSLYREDLGPESVLLPNVPRAVSWTLGAGAGNAYTFEGKRVFAKRLQRAPNGDNELVSVEFTFVEDATTSTDMTISKTV